MQPITLIMDQKIINLFDEYTHKPLSRELFLKRLAKLTGGSSAALAILPLLEANYAMADTVKEADEDIITSDVTYGPDMKGYLAQPKTKNKRGSVVVIHENRGLNPHTKDLARRLAKSGFTALAPDALAPVGGTPANEDEARMLIGKLDAKENLGNFLKSLSYLRSLPESNGKTACIGFCWGGALANQLAVQDPVLNSAAAFYGRQPDSTEVPKIKARLQLHYGGLDERINAGIPAFEAALKLAGTRYEIFIYEGAQHAFLNDTAPTRFNPEAAKLAWERTLKLLTDTIS